MENHISREGNLAETRDPARSTHARDHTSSGLNVVEENHPIDPLISMRHSGDLSKDWQANPGCKPQPRKFASPQWRVCSVRWRDAQDRYIYNRTSPPGEPVATSGIRVHAQGEQPKECLRRRLSQRWRSLTEPKLALLILIVSSISHLQLRLTSRPFGPCRPWENGSSHDYSDIEHPRDLP